MIKSKLQFAYTLWKEARYHCISLFLGLTVLYLASSALFLSPQTITASEGVYPLWSTQQEPIAVSQDSVSFTTTFSQIVSIQGAVKKPGVYELPAYSRVIDVINLAQGLSENVDHTYVSSQLNLSRALSDGEQLYIPFEFEREVVLGSAGNGDGVVASDQKVSINSATLSQLQELPDIGLKRAEDIVGARPYSQISDLVQREVLTQSLFQKLESRLIL